MWHSSPFSAHHNITPFASSIRVEHGRTGTSCLVWLNPLFNCCRTPSRTLQTTSHSRLISHQFSSLRYTYVLLPTVLNAIFPRATVSRYSCGLCLQSTPTAFFFLSSDYITSPTSVPASTSSNSRLVNKVLEVTTPPPPLVRRSPYIHRTQCEY